MAEVTSKINRIDIDTSGRGSGAAAFNKTVFTATKVTGPTGNPPQYQTEIIRYSDAKGNDPVTIGTRNNKGKITFNDNASSTDKKGSSQIARVSTAQINSPEIQALASNASQKASLNGSAGQPNKAQGSGDNDATPTTVPVSDPPPKTRSSFGGSQAIVFPQGLTTVDRDIIKFKMMEYRPSGLSRSQSGGIGEMGKGRETNGKIIGTVILPIPGGINSTDAVNWGSGNMNPIEAFAANVALDAFNEDLGAAAGTVKRGAQKVLENSDEVKKGLKSAIAGAASGIGAQALQRAEGMVVNPNMELLFNGPQLRSFGFTFKLSPRSAREASIVASILRFFKQGMAPIRTPSNFFLKAPHTFQLQYIHLSLIHI